MKRCPTCTRTFLDEQLSYCTDDGTPLVDQPQSSSFDPQATVLAPSPNTNEISQPQPTRPFRQDDMPGGRPAPYSWSEPATPSTPSQQAWGTPTPPIAPWSPPSSPPAWRPPPPPSGRFAAKTSQHNPVAIASLALGVFSLTIGLCCYLGIGTGPIAIVLGAVAISQMKNNPTQPADKGMAIAGIATGAAALGLIILFFILGVAMGAWR